MNQNAINKITLQLQNYFDGLYFCDVELLQTVFHPEAMYVCATEEKLIKLNMTEYFPVIAERTSPASKNEARMDKIISISVLSETTAVAHVECAIQPKYFSDLLSFIYIDGTWKIISKVFHYQLMKTN